MRYLLLLLLLTTAPTIRAQSPTAPIKVDWRYNFSWTNPNPPGAVTNWIVYASNNVPGGSVRMTSTLNTSLDLKPLLNGAVAGTYALNATAVSDLSDLVPSTNLFVIWPGGDGKIKPGHNLGSAK